MAPSFLKRITSKAPILFPLVALFHIFLLVRYIADLWGSPLTTPVVLPGAWFGIAALLAVFICDLRRWANISYIALTILGLLLQYLAPKGSDWQSLGTTLFPFDLLMCVFLLFYYKRFE